MLGIQETYIDRTNGGITGEYIAPIEDTILDGTLPNLYKYGLSEYGRCIGKVYVDTDDGAKHVGYVFVKRIKYDAWGTADTYLAETWISVGEYHPAIAERIEL